MSFSDRIGELPSRASSGRTRGRWPWDRIRRSLSSSLGIDEGGGGGNSDVDGGDARNESIKDAAGSPPSSSPDVADETADRAGTTRGGDGAGAAGGGADPSKGPCIGSIFGLDIGGTLAKMVYFERQESRADELRAADVYRKRWRREHYHQAASARAVLAARRGEDGGGGLVDEASGAGAEGVRKVLWEGGGQSEPALGGADSGKPRRRGVAFNTASLPPRHRQHHTVQSEEDLKRLWDVRQASVPDDLDEYAEELHHDSLRGAESLHSSPVTMGSAPSPDAPKPLARSNSLMTKSRSMFDFSTHITEHAEALDRFYNFARRLDAYEHNIKDEQLSFYSRRLGGEFHFIRFETRAMGNAMDLIRANDLHRNIAEMGATGGGAHKYADDWDRMLGIEMVKVEELDSLVAGMQFVLADVVGECYTFQPRKSFVEAKNARQTAAGGVRVDSSDDIGAAAAAATAEAEAASTEHAAGATSSVGDAVTTAAGPSSVEMGNGASSHSTSSCGDDSDSDYHIGHLRPDPQPPQSQNQAPATAVPPPRTSSSASSTASTPKTGSEGTTKVDEWWWSRKVQKDVASSSDLYPHLLVTIGTGVSILRVDGPRRHERISGSTIGGGTYWGLCRLLTDAESFDDVLNLAERGDPTKVDMMVGDIYGNNPDALEKLGLPSDIVASSFGKLVAKADPADGLRQEDLARALLLMVTNNIGQVAYLNSRLHGTKRIYFVGNFLRHNQISQRRLAYAINYWSGGGTEALFLEHEGYFGALGAFLLSQGIPTRETVAGDDVPATDDGAAAPRRRRSGAPPMPSPLGVPPSKLERRSTDALSQAVDLAGESTTDDEGDGGGGGRVSMAAHRNRARTWSH